MLSIYRQNTTKAKKSCFIETPLVRYSVRKNSNIPAREKNEKMLVSKRPKFFRILSDPSLHRAWNLANPCLNRGSSGTKPITRAKNTSRRGKSGAGKLGNPQGCGASAAPRRNKGIRPGSESRRESWKERRSRPA